LHAWRSTTGGALPCGANENQEAKGNVTLSGVEGNVIPSGVEGNVILSEVEGNVILSEVEGAMMARRFFALFACAALCGAMPRPMPGGTPWTAAELATVRRTIDQLFSATALRGAQIGFFAIDTARNSSIDERNADADFIPASNFKLVVGSAALDRLGEDFSYTTTLLADAPNTGGTIDGDLVLRGGGDALLKAADLDAAAAAVAASGVKRVTGSLVTDVSHDDDRRWGAGWSWDDLPYGYAPAVCALELEDGIVHVTVEPGAEAGAPVIVHVTPQTTAFTVDSRITTGSKGSADTTDIVRPWDAPRTIELIGSYPLDATISDDFEPSVPDPESYAGDVLVRALAAHGVTVGGGVRDGKTPAGAITLWSHASETMPKLLADFWYPSDNLMGELMLKELGVAERGEPGSVANGLLVEEQYLRSIGVDPATVTIADGSGLSSYDRITPRDLVAILQSDWNSPHRDVAIDALPLAGVRGTLRDEFLGTAAQGSVFAKTGSMNHVRTISGFIQTKTHGPVTFSFLINNWMGERNPTGNADLAKIRGAVLATIAEQ
jgi:serine-type D-Ala-D-Ala carboxypeptidase/endopeptidase (penicillin-binding protein 4)